MKRYRILAFFDFDSRVLTLTDPIRDDWDETIKELHHQNRQRTVAELSRAYGALDADKKLQNFIDIGKKPMSVLAFHNAFFEQVRSAFVSGNYYPAMTGACALGERILNHLILTLREDFRSTTAYKKIYKKKSFDDWSLAIDTLIAWDVLLPQVQVDFRRLMHMRNQAIHFRPETDQNDRELALRSILCLQQIIGEQFSGFGSQPWFITGVPGEIYIRKSWESQPFIKAVYLKNGPRVSVRHTIESVHPGLRIVDPELLNEGEPISDQEFSTLRRTFNAA